MKPRPRILVLPSLNVVAFDEAGQQIPELQESLATTLAKRLTAAGYAADGCIVATPCGRLALFQTVDGEWNHSEL